MKMPITEENNVRINDAVNELLKIIFEEIRKKAVDNKMSPETFLLNFLNVLTSVFAGELKVFDELSKTVVESVEEHHELKTEYTGS